MKSKFKLGCELLIFLALGLVSGILFKGNIKYEDGKLILNTKSTIELSDTIVKSIIETADGDIEVLLPTVESVNSNQQIDENTLDFGRGAYHDISSPVAYKDSVIDQCIDLDGKWGSQCVDLFADYNYQYTARWLSTCGTGAAYGLWDCKEQNAGDDYTLIYDPLELKAGDWIVFKGGEFGHVGMAMGSYNEGYIALLGENQGGRACEGGGAAANIINISLKNFLGAFRPNIYITPDPEPEPIIPISGCKYWNVVRGDTMSRIMLECENTVVYGEPMNDYAKTWWSLIYNPNHTVYDGWNSPNGVGLFAGDELEHKW